MTRPRRILAALCLCVGAALLPLAPVPARADAGDSVPALIDQAADDFGLSRATLRRIAICESGMRPWATSPWGHRGVYQFNRVTWGEQAPTIGAPRDFAAAYDPELNVRLAASLMARGQRWRWSCR